MEEKKHPIEILGWSTYDFSDFTSNPCDAMCYGGTEEEDAAVVRAIKRDGVCFTGNHHQDDHGCAPVTTDYRMLRYSTRRWGALMAMARGEGEENYLKYAWRGLSDTTGGESLKIVRPTGGQKIANTVNVQTTFDVSETLYNKIAAVENLEDGVFLYAVTPVAGGYYWLDDDIYFNYGGGTAVTSVRKLLAYNTMDQFMEDIVIRQENDICAAYVFDREQIEAVAAKGRFLLLGVHIVIVL